MVPVEVLTCDLAALKSNDGDNPNFDAPARGRYAGDHPIHDLVMGKAIDCFFDKSVFSDDL